MMGGRYIIPGYKENGVYGYMSAGLMNEIQQKLPAVFGSEVELFLDLYII